ncbi:radical SAM/SPASM domain-containing protein [Azospirillum sp. ST 5-10]|uniref:radical SAM/SPASM domain-containing protein n=1 Tax=unclassified Azospirillum TaxID=2630922 RepID=UPI003F49DB50
MDVLLNHPKIDVQTRQTGLMHNGLARPLALKIETVNTCNNLCLICAYPVQSVPKKIMSMDMFEKVVSDYQDIGGGKITFTPVVGEVFLDKLFLDRLHFLETATNVTPSVTTNAAMLDRFSDDEVKYMLTVLNRVQVSVYGLDDEEYEAMTKRRTYKRMIEGLARLLAFGDGKVFVALRLLKSRKKEDIINWLKFEIAPLVRSYGTVKSVNILVTSTMTGNYSNWGILDTSKPLPFGATWSERHRVVKGQCIIPALALSVSSNGDISFCACDDFDHHESLFLGNAKTASLRDVLTSDRFADLWNWKKNGVPDYCKSCSFYKGIDTLHSRPNALDDVYNMIGA